MSDITRIRAACGAVHWSATVPLGLGVFGMAGSAALSMGSLTLPGPGMWPFIVSACLAAVSIPLMFTRLGAAGLERFGTSGLYVVAGAVSVGIFVVAFQQAGMILPGFLLLLFWLRFLGNERWLTSVPTAVLVPIGLYVVFDVLLSVPLPEDIVILWS